MRPKITYQRHNETVAELQHFFPCVTGEQAPGGEGFAAAEIVTLTTHNSTHLDAPWHYHPTSRGVKVTGADAWSWDAPFSYTAKKVAETGDTSLIWEGHKNT